MNEYIPFFILVILLFVKVPVAWSVIIASLSYFRFIDTSMPVDLIFQRLISQGQSFTYLAAPFFILAGTAMNYSGISARLLAVADLITGRMRGGLAQSNVVLSTLMGGACGSQNADAAMEIKLLGPPMLKQGYSGGYVCAITAMTATISTIIPPGIGLILYALYANQSVGNMFMAGYLPGLLLCAALMISVNIEARKKGYGVTRAERMPGRQAAKIIIGSVWALVLPLAIILGIRFGAFTATEGGAVAAVYSLFLGIFVYKELKWKMLPGVFYEALMDTCNIMLVIVSMAAFSYYLNWEGIPLRIAYAITSISSSKWVFLLLTNLLLLVLGMFMDGSAILAIIVPIFYPIAESFGIDLIHFGLIMVFNISIGASTPPFGTLIFITTGALNVKFADFCREMWSCLIPMLIVLALITIFPFLSTFLPGIL